MEEEGGESEMEREVDRRMVDFLLLLFWLYEGFWLHEHLFFVSVHMSAEKPLRLFSGN